MTTKTRKETSCIQYDIRKLSQNDIDMVEQFHCADSYPEKGLEDFLKKHAYDDMVNGDGATYLIVNEESHDLYGFFTIVASSLPYYYEDPIEPDVPPVLCGISAIKISYFAVDKKYQDVFYQSGDEYKPIAAWLIDAVIGMIDDMSISTLGAKAIYLRPLPSAESFYFKNRFKFNDDFSQPLASDDDDLNVMLIMLHHVDGL